MAGFDRSILEAAMREHEVELTTYGRRDLLVVTPETVIRWHRPGLAPVLAVAVARADRPSARQPRRP